MLSKGNCIIGQSGGPTVAINASLSGVLQGIIESDAYNSVYGMVHGIEGLLQGSYLNLSEQFKTKESLDKLAITPSMYLGSCRFKLPHYEVAPEIYEILFNFFTSNDIRTVFYIGGNDSMDTVSKLSRYAAKIQSPIRVIGVPKTIDNDLVETDHTPGFGSAAKFVATTVREIAIDASVYDNKKSVTIVEIMGRHAGWLTAASALARKFEGDNPVLIYLPEVAFNQEEFLEKVKKALETTPNLVVCVSEGINDGNGTFICEFASDVGVDTFGHKMLTGSGKYLENLIKEKLGVKVRSVELNVSQRCSSSCLSKTDLDEADHSGAFAVNAALNGETGKMISFVRANTSPYELSFSTADVNIICNQEKAVPLSWITKDGSDVTDEFIRYAAPLIQGSVDVPTENGLPLFAFRK